MTISRRSVLAGLMACPICASARAESKHHWNYQEAEHWGEIDKIFEACSVGSEQAPIVLTHAIKADVDDLKIDWKPQTYAIVNNGHTIQLNAEAGSSITLGVDGYALKQFHFHTPSEHAFGGKRTTMEVHFVHAHDSGRLAVVGVLLVAGNKNDAFAAIMAKAPKKESEDKLKILPLDPSVFLPPNREIFRYEGSLTTPPCSEIVDWAVMEKTVEVAQADIDAFKAIFPMNARPLQKLNRRFVLTGP